MACEKGVKNKNKEFNSVSKNFIDDLFQQERIGKEGYIKSKEEYFQMDRFYNEPHSENTISEASKITDDLTSLVNNAKFGPSERMLASYLMTSTYNIIVITGAMGSGKTAISNYVLDNLTTCIEHDQYNFCNRCSLKKVYKIHLNFNEGFKGSNVDIIVRKFDKLLKTKLLRALSNVFSGRSYILTAFFDYIQNTSNLDWSSLFDDFIDDYIEKDEIDWNNLTSFRKQKYLFAWLKKQTDFIFELTGYMVRFLTQESYVDKRCFIMFFDNIDQLPELAQNEIITSIYQLTEITKTKTLLTVRLTGFGWIPAGASFAYGHMPLSGILPNTILFNRISYYLENKEEYASTRNLLHESIINNIDDKLELLKLYIEPESESRLKNVLDSLGGNSIRRTLFLSTRIFLNNVISFEESNPKEDDLIRSLFIGSFENCRMDYDDRLVTNLFISELNYNNSMMKIRILQIIYHYKKLGRKTTIQILIDQLRHYYGRIIMSEFLQVLNVFLNQRKKLIYIDGIGYYPNSTALVTSTNDQISITYTGMQYIKFLTLDFVYVQECFKVITWNDTSMPIDYDSHELIQRIRHVRKGLRIFVEEDYKQMKRYNSISHPHNHIDKRMKLNFIVKHLANSTYHILFKTRSEIKTLEEIEEWCNLLLLCNSYSLKLGIGKEDKIISIFDKIVTDYKLRMPNNQWNMDA